MKGKAKIDKNNLNIQYEYNEDRNVCKRTLDGQHKWTHLILFDESPFLFFFTSKKIQKIYKMGKCIACGMMR